jgi:hypothetical protein
MLRTQISCWIKIIGTTKDLQLRVVRSGCIVSELLGIGCYLDDFGARVRTSAAKTARGTANGNGRVIFCLGTVVLCATTLAVQLVIGARKKLDLVWRLRTLCKLCVVSVTEISDRGELNVARVDAGSITAMVMLKLTWRRAGNGPVISVDRRDSDY